LSHQPLTDTDQRATPAPTSDLDRLVVFAGTFHDLPTDDRERLASRLAAAKEGLAERLLLHTCHRAELVAVLDPEAADSRLPRWRGADAVERVLTVAAGLDSAIVAEEQLLGQVRDAYTAALARHETGPILNELLRRALRFGKRVRSAALPSGDRSLAARALQWVAQRDVAGDVLIVGTGMVAGQIGAGLASRGLRCTIASRSTERAGRLAAELRGGRAAASVEAALVDTTAWQLIVLATRTAGPILTVHAGSGLVIDLCAPSGIDPGLRPALGERLLDLDRLGHSTNALPPTTERRLRTELADERDRFVAWLAQRGSRDEIRRLHDRAEDARHRHLERLRRRADLRDDQLQAVERMTGALVNELLHEPMLRLRERTDH
jgi:glutamyl-tRNA reductase